MRLLDCVHAAGLTENWLQTESGKIIMAVHKKILEWQAAHPTITWVGWGVVWAIVLALLIWPRRVAG